MQDVENKKKGSFVHVFSHPHFTFPCNLFALMSCFVFNMFEERKWKK